MSRLTTLLLMLVLVPSASAETATVSRSYMLPEHGTLQMLVPDSWQEGIGRPPNNLPPTIQFRPKQGAPFKVIVTPIWEMDGKKPPLDPPAIRTLVESSAAPVRPSAVEGTLTFKDLKGTSGAGHYFVATDRAPPPGEFKYIAQGGLRVGDLLVIFTILTNDGQEFAVRDALAMLQSALHRPK